MDYESEDQQIEALKRWWDENGKSLIIGVVVGVAAIFGFREYSAHQLGQSQLASDLYNVVNVQVSQDAFTDVNKLEQLKTDFPGTPYAALAGLAVASYEYRKGNVDAAIAELQWVETNTEVEETLHLARVRLATIYLSEKQYDKARPIVQQSYPAAFAGRYEELKGDLYAAEGNIEEAIAAYDRAIASAGLNMSPLLQLKRRNLGG